MTAALVGPPVTDPVVDRAVAGDEAAFTVLVERHQDELRGHCRRLLRSPEGADDALQEALLRAWRARATFAGRATFRSWLYRIATNACLDQMRRDRGAPLPPDEHPREPASTEPGPDTLLEGAEAIENACRRVVALLAPQQRAVLLLCDVLRCSSKEAAHLLGTTVVAVNSARQRARATLRDARPAPPVRLDVAERALLDRYVEALRRHDVGAVMTVARADAARGTSNNRRLPARPVGPPR